jgi:Family of unknown function (DUF6356)
MFKRLFFDHPASVGENYRQHFGVATRFGLILLWGGARAVLHGFIPAICKTSGSDTVIRLHNELVAKRNAARDARSIEWMI